MSGKTGTGYLLTVVDRKLRVGFIRQVLPVTIAGVEDAFLDVQKHCHAYHSWEKGTVENYNKQVRKYVKKGSDISQYSHEYLAFVEARLNDRFMSVLDYLTPGECLSSYRMKVKEKPR